jgi:hypothetical protein
LVVWKTLPPIPGSGTSTEIRSYVYEDSDIKTGSYNYRIRQIDFDGTVTVYSLANAVEFGAPTNFELSQNYPNPFNPSTTISFSLPNTSKVTLKVFDILGNEITTLVDDQVDAGNHSIEFNAAGLSSGIYFYRIQAGNFTETRKMNLLK